MPRAPAGDVRDDFLHRPMARDAALLHARLPNLIQERFPVQVLFVELAEELGFVHWPYA